MWLRWLPELLPFSIIAELICCDKILERFFEIKWINYCHFTSIVVIEDGNSWFGETSVIFFYHTVITYELYPFNFVCLGVGLRNPLSKVAMSRDDFWPSLIDHLADISHQSPDQYL